VIIRQEGKSYFRPGDSLTFSPKGQNFHLFDAAGMPVSH